MPENRFEENVSEFKGSTSAKLDIIFVELKEIKGDVKDLRDFKARMLGMATLAGFAAGFIKDWLFRQ